MKTPYPLIGNLSVAQRAYLEQSAAKPIPFPSAWLSRHGLVVMVGADGWGITAHGRGYLEWLKEVEQEIGESK